MVRPCFLVIDREFADSISTRKLVIETAKLNVITAYSSAEAIETLKMFPAVSGIVLDAGMRDMTCETLVKRLKAVAPKVPIIVVSRPNADACHGADYHVEGFEPSLVLNLLRTLEPEQSAAIEKRNELLSKVD